MARGRYRSFVTSIAGVVAVLGLAACGGGDLSSDRAGKASSKVDERAQKAVVTVPIRSGRPDFDSVGCATTTIPPGGTFDDTSDFVTGEACLDARYPPGDEPKPGTGVLLVQLALPDAGGADAAWVGYETVTGVSCGQAFLRDDRPIDDTYAVPKAGPYVVARCQPTSCGEVLCWSARTYDTASSRGFLAGGTVTSDADTVRVKLDNGTHDVRLGEQVVPSDPDRRPFLFRADKAGAIKALEVFRGGQMVHRETWP